MTSSASPHAIKGRMNYRDSLRVEEEGLQLLAPWLDRQYAGRYVLLYQHDNVKWWQREAGDLLVQIDGRAFQTVELKFERKFTGNLFVETWSNKSSGASGWLLTCKSDRLLYVFLDARRMFSLTPATFRGWVESNVDARKWKQVRQHKYTQTNDTYGVLVPITEALEAGALEEVHLEISH